MNQPLHYHREEFCVFYIVFILFLIVDELLLLFQTVMIMCSVNTVVNKAALTDKENVQSIPQGDQ